MTFQFSHLFIQLAFFEYLLCARSHARHCKHYRTINKTGSCPCLQSTYCLAGKTTKITQKELYLMVHRPQWGLHSILSTRACPIKIWISNFSLQLRKKNGNSRYESSIGNTCGAEKWLSIYSPVHHYSQLSQTVPVSPICITCPAPKHI